MGDERRDDESLSIPASFSTWDSIQHQAKSPSALSDDDLKKCRNAINEVIKATTKCANNYFSKDEKDRLTELERGLVTALKLDSSSSSMDSSDVKTLRNSYDKYKECFEQYYFDKYFKSHYKRATGLLAASVVVPVLTAGIICCI